VLDTLRKRPHRLGSESITSFVSRLLYEYKYGKGAERYFWITIRKLEEEGKIKRCRNGKRKNIFLCEANNIKEEFTSNTNRNRLKVLKDFVSQWAHDFSM